MAATKNARDIFLDALDRAPADRAAYLDGTCGDDAALRQRVEALLRADDDPGAFLSDVKPSARGPGREPLPGAPRATVDSADGPARRHDYADPTASVGAIIAGRYKLLEEIGEGGMGTVWVAEQTEPVKRKVALKLIKPGMDSKAVLARFEAERQALALMDHPNIAKVLDGGLTETGRPFFVMEYFKGVPITEYCDAARLSVADRLNLFTQVCCALQHAHQKGIIHRDLKPSNILVAPYDDRPVPKVIDFGLAKAMHQALTERTLHTAHETVLGTPLYMSPEQAQLNNLDVDTRSDIYSLGVLLYELLTGTTPLEKGRFKDAAWDEVRRIIREEEPPRPSTRLSSNGTLPSLAACRQTEPAYLTKLIRGELDWIVMKALEKNRTRRYETANALSRDIQRYLADEVVEARPPSAGYRIHKFVRRHKGQVIAASLLLLTLLSGIAGTTWGLIEARRQEQEARRQAGIAREETAEKEKARLAEAERVKERDGALLKEAERVTERNAALDKANHQLDNSSFLLAVAAYDNREVDQARLRLDSIDAKHRGWEWHYLRRQCTGGIFTCYGHTDAVTSVAFSPDGTRIVTASADQTARVWEARTGTPQLDLKGHTSWVVSLAFSPDGARIVTGSYDHTAKVWDARTGTPQLELKGHTSWVTSVAFSPDSTRIVTGSADQTVRVWDARTGALQLELKRPLQWPFSGEFRPDCVAFSPDGTRIVTVSVSDGAKVWDARTGALQLELKGHKGMVTSAAFSPDGARIVTGSGLLDRPVEVKVWDARTGTPLLELTGHTRTVRSLAFSPDGARIVTGSNDQTAKLWDARTGSALLELKGHTGAVSSVAFSPDGSRIVTGSDDRTAKVWDARNGTPRLELKALTPRMVSVAFSPDGTRIVTGNGGGGTVPKSVNVKLWDARTGTPELELKWDANVEPSVALSPDGTRILTNSHDRTAKVWDARTGTAQLELKGHTNWVTSVAFSPDGTRIVTGSDDRTAKVWDARNGTPQLELKGHTDKVLSVAFSPDGTRIVTGSRDGTAQVWDAQTGAPQPKLKGHAAAVNGVAFSPDSTRIVTGSDDRTAKVWDARIGTPLLELKGHTRNVWSAAFSPDGTRVITGSLDGTVKVWDAETGTRLLELHPTTVVSNSTAVYSAAFSADGTRIVTGTYGGAANSYRGTAKVWDARPSAPPLELKGHRLSVLSVAFSLDGRRMVTGSQDDTAKVWDARTGTAQLELKGHTNRVTCAAFSPDSTRIVTGSWDKTAKVWDARTGTPLLELKGLGFVMSVAFSRDGTRIVTIGQGKGVAPWPLDRSQTAKVWDARTGQELKGEPIPQTIPNNCISADGRFFAHPVGDRVELIPLQPNEEELSYRLLHTEPNLGRYREAYEATRADKDDFAARFYLNLLPPAEKKVLEAKAAEERAALEAKAAAERQLLEASAAAEREIAAGRTQDAVVHLVILSTANPKDTILFQKVTNLQAWFGQEKEHADSCRRGLVLAENTRVPETADRVAKACCLLPRVEKTQREAALTLARKAVDLGGKNPNLPYFHLALGMAEYRNGHFAEADAALIAAAKSAGDNGCLAGMAAFYRAMSLFQQDKKDEARKLAIEAAATMKPLPKDEKNPLAGVADPDNLILWLAYKEAKAMIQFDEVSLPAPKDNQD